MKEIYIVSSGQYSDYGIDGVFSTKELAQAYIDSFSKKDGWDEMDIEIWELDPHKEDLHNKRKVYFVSMTQNGEVLNVRIDSSAYGIKYKDSRDGLDANGNFYTHCFADDEKHAIKICAERKLTSKFK